MVALQQWLLIPAPIQAKRLKLKKLDDSIRINETLENQFESFP